MTEIATVTSENRKQSDDFFVKILVVSSVIPDANGMSGNLVLHRYLNLNPCIKTEVLKWTEFPLRLKIIGKLRQCGFVNLSRLLECLVPVLPPMKMVKQKIEAFQPDVILTVAHGFWHIQAAAAAKEFNLPLVSFFQDWWPEFSDVLSPFRQQVEKQIMKTRDASNVSICVSEGMRQMLGNPSNSLLIHDIPSQVESNEWKPQINGTLRVVYFGNLQEYGPSIEQALLALENSKNVRLEVYGPKPLWSLTSKEKFTKSTNYRGLVAPDKLLGVLKEFHANLVVMSFTPTMKRRMTSSFPSKLIEGMQLGLPAIIWGPEYCSAVQWARQGNRALCVTDPNPVVLRQALEKLAASIDEQQRLAKAARQAAQTDFDPDRIQKQFMDALRGIVKSQPK
jgi:glycosyltransferase involved in cell wall biosynthesis